MAGFLFRKQKEDLSIKRPAAVSSPTTLQPPGSTPLYARFSKTTQNGSTPTARLVSSPMPLGNKQDKKPNGVDARLGYSTSSLTSVDGGRKDLNVQQAHLRAGEVPSVRPISQMILDKPLPPPVPAAEEKPTQIRQSPSNRLGPPSAFPLQQQISNRGRVSMDLQSRDNKPLPRPGSAQSSYPLAPGAPAPARSRSTSVAPPPSINFRTKEDQSRATSISTPKSKGEESYTISPIPLSKTRISPPQKSYRAEIASPGLASAPSMPEIGLESDHEVPASQSIVEAAPSSERTVELPDVSISQVSLVISDFSGCSQVSFVSCVPSAWLAGLIMLTFENPPLGEPVYVLKLFLICSVSTLPLAFLSV